MTCARSIRVLSLLTFMLLSAGSFLVAGEVTTMSVDELHQRLAKKDAKPLVVDVRETSEWDEGHIDGALLKPLGSIDELEVDKNREIVLVCRSGRRSAKAFEVLAARGYTKLWNLEGGMLEWEKRGYPVTTK